MKNTSITVTFLGTGTSQGVPVIGCDCAVCRSADPRDQRLRTALLIAAGPTRVAIDCGPDFRQQMLRSGTKRLDGVVLTHEHNDHIIGIDDVRPFNFRQRTDMPIYATPHVIAELHRRFAYIFAENPYPGAPMLQLHAIDKDTSFSIGSLDFQPIEVWHGRMPVLGFRVGNFTYITDMKTIQPEERAKLQGTETLVINALHHKPHHSHLNLEEALEFISEIGPRQAFLTHISHRMGCHEEVNRTLLPPGVKLAYDGLEIVVESL